MSEKKETDKDSRGDDKIEQHKKSTDASKKKQEVSKASKKKAETANNKEDDWNDPTGNSHLGKKS